MEGINWGVICAEIVNLVYGSRITWNNPLWPDCIGPLDIRHCTGDSIHTYYDMPVPRYYDGEQLGFLWEDARRLLGFEISCRKQGKYILAWVNMLPLAPKKYLRKESVTALHERFFAANTLAMYNALKISNERLPRWR